MAVRFCLPVGAITGIIQAMKRGDSRQARAPDRPATGRKPRAIGGVTLDAWRRLYELGDRIRDLAPWRWIGEDEYFGVEVPDATPPVWLVTFLGGIHREFFACTAYAGWEALRDALAVQASDSADDAIRILEIPHLQAAFTDRRYLYPAEKRAVRAIGRTYAGPHDWPVFRDFRAGYLPWPVNASQAHVLTAVLNQALGIALRVEDDRRLLQTRPGAYIFRVPDGAGGWRDEWRETPALPEPVLTIGVDAAAARTLRQARTLAFEVEVDLVLTQGTVRPGTGQRPQTLYMLAVVDAVSGHVHGAEVMQATDGNVAAMWAQVPDTVVRLWQRMGGCPRQANVRSDRMMNVLRPLTEMFPFRLTRRQQLPGFDRFHQGLDAFLSRPPTPNGSSAPP
jgi:hypothetical protein